MIEEIKTMLGERAANYTDAQISLCLKWALAEAQTYCRRDIDLELELCAQKMAIVKLNRIGTEGITSQAYSGVSETYIDGYPEDIQAVLRSKRKVKVL